MKDVLHASCEPFEAGREPRLLDFDFGADFFELLLDGGRFVLGHAFLDRLRRALDEVLRFLEAQAEDLPQFCKNADWMKTMTDELWPMRLIDSNMPGSTKLPHTQ